MAAFTLPPMIRHRTSDSGLSPGVLNNLLQLAPSPMTNSPIPLVDCSVPYITVPSPYNNILPSSESGPSDDDRHHTNLEAQRRRIVRWRSAPIFILFMVINNGGYNPS